MIPAERACYGSSVDDSGLVVVTLSGSAAALLIRSLAKLLRAASEMLAAWKDVMAQMPKLAERTTANAAEIAAIRESIAKAQEAARERMRAHGKALNDLHLHVGGHVDDARERHHDLDKRVELIEQHLGMPQRDRDRTPVRGLPLPLPLRRPPSEPSESG